MVVTTSTVAVITYSSVASSNAAFPTTPVWPIARSLPASTAARSRRPFRLRELPFVEHLVGSLVADAEVCADVMDAIGAAHAHRSKRRGGGLTRLRLRRNDPIVDADVFPRASVNGCLEFELSFHSIRAEAQQAWRGRRWDRRPEGHVWSDRIVVEPSFRSHPQTA